MQPLAQGQWWCEQENRAIWLQTQYFFNILTYLPFVNISGFSSHSIYPHTEEDWERMILALFYIRAIKA